MVVNQFIAHQRARGLSPRTIKRRRWALGKFPNPLTITADELERAMGELEAAESRKALLCDVRQFVLWARRRGLIEHDPTELVGSVRVPRRIPQPLTGDELERILSIATGSIRWAVLLGAYAGLRVSEIHALRYDDLRRDLGLIMVRDGKGGRDDSVPLAPIVAAEIPADRSGPIFGHLTDGDAVSRRIQAVMRLAGVPGRPHRLRHTFGTAVARKTGGNIFLVQRLMRHASITSSERYVRLWTSGVDVVSGLYDVA